MSSQLDIEYRHRHLSGKMILPLSLSAAVGFVALQACEIIIAEDVALVVATRVLSASLFLAFAVATWMQAEAHVLRKLILRPRFARKHAHVQASILLSLVRRVMYFSIATVTGECLFLAMIKELEPASTGLLSIAGAACFLLVPFFDAMSPEVVGPTHVRAVCTPLS
jgi:hypothetical protein